MRLPTALLGLIPGAAHIHLGRPRRGLACFFAFAFFVNGAFIAPFLVLGKAAPWIFAAAAAGTWIVAMGDACRLEKATKT